jgi:cobalamin biosynthesis Mg chelatase CobN
MTYEEQARAWVQTAPIVEITVGRFTLKYQFGADPDWGWVWEYMLWLTPSEYKHSPEHKYLAEIIETLNSSTYNIEFIDELIKAMQKKPFNQGESE